MQQININHNQFSDLLNLLNGVFFPLDNFVSKKEFLEIVNFKKYNKKIFSISYLFWWIKNNIENKGRGKISPNI